MSRGVLLPGANLMTNSRFASTLLGAVCALSLSACHSAADLPRITLNANTVAAVPEKKKLFVVGTYSANFGKNGQLFEDSFAEQAKSCQVSVEFFHMPNVGDKLTLDPKAETAAAQAELLRRLAASQPDGILEVNTAGWHAPGGLSSDPNIAMTYGSFDLKLHLLDGKKRIDQWHSDATVNVRSGMGGELLAPKVVQQLAIVGALPHCPK